MILLNIRQYREKCGLSRTALALLADIEPERLELYENGKAVPLMDTVVKLAHICRVTTDELFGLSPESGRMEVE